MFKILDVGFGYTKYSAEEDGELLYKSFPSIAPRSSKIENSDLSMINERDTIIVTVDGTSYEVGPDSLLLETSDTTRTLNDQVDVNTMDNSSIFGNVFRSGRPVLYNHRVQLNYKLPFQYLLNEPADC